ncbi:hypothetical protein ABIB62_000979 [Mucilaginibacter sp. UYP25]
MEFLTKAILYLKFINKNKLWIGNFKSKAIILLQSSIAQLHYLLKREIGETAKPHTDPT